MSIGICPMAEAGNDIPLHVWKKTDDHPRSETFFVSHTVAYGRTNPGETLTIAQIFTNAPLLWALMVSASCYACEKINSIDC